MSSAEGGVTGVRGGGHSMCQGAGAWSSARGHVTEKDCTSDPRRLKSCLFFMAGGKKDDYGELEILRFC